jgi:hypothetical protein
MAKRIIVAGILGGIVMFVWQSIAHMVLPLGQVGVKRMDNEEAVLSRLQENIYAPGFYFFPAPEFAPDMTRAQKQEAIRNVEPKYRTGPTGVLIYHPRGEHTFAKQLTFQFGANLLAALLSAYLLGQASGLKSFAERLAFVTLLGAVPTLAVNLPYWNWYGFPANYTLAQFADQVLAFFAAGLVLAGIVKPRAS